MSTFDWTRYVNVADDLARQDDEAYLRAAISRLYYAVYGVARQQLEQQGHTRTIRGHDHKHSIVWQFYNYDQTSSGESVMVEGERLRNQRVDADYFDHKHIRRIDWELARERALAILDFLNTL